MESDQSRQADEYKRYKYIIENIKDVIWEMNIDYVYTFVSPNAKDMTGYEANELIGRRLLDFLTEESRSKVHDLAVNNIDKRLDGETTAIVLQSVQFICKNKSVKWFEVSASPVFKAGNFIGYIGTTRDITEKKEYESQLKKYIAELKLMNAKLEKMATVDALTGAYSRRKFDDDLNTLILQKKRNGISFALIFLDIDNFKTINDCYGHKMGDCVLTCVSRLLRENIRVKDSLFRWGGDEFILILSESNLESANIVADKLKKIIQCHNFGIDQKITISLSVGEYQPDENNDQIIVRLDNALLKAKSLGKNTVMSC